MKPNAAIIAINHDNKNIEINEIGKGKRIIEIDEKIDEIIEKFNKKDIFNLGRLVGENDIKP